MPNSTDKQIDMHDLVAQIQSWSVQLGFQQCGISDTHLPLAEQRLMSWLDSGYQGDMHWMQKHGSKRARPAELEPGTLSVISVRMDYWPAQAQDAWDIINQSNKAYVSRYATGRDYHKLMRQRLQRLADKMSGAVGAFGYRVFVDSAPVLEKPLAQKAQLGWIGKHTNLINKDAGSWFFLGELYTDLPLPVTSQASDDHCGTCQACLDVCPTQAIIAPYQLDARRCISYLTIEHKGSIPVEFRQAMGNRIYGCDDCQLVCPWNKFSANTGETDFAVRCNLDDIDLLELFSWDASEFAYKFQGSAIRRIGYEAWMRNIAVALGNATTSDAVVTALKARAQDHSELIREHVAWALSQHGST